MFFLTSSSAASVGLEHLDPAMPEPITFLATQAKSSSFLFLELGFPSCNQRVIVSDGPHCRPQPDLPALFPQPHRWGTSVLGGLREAREAESPAK